MKKIIVIGASSGIGRRIASDFARMGWRVGAAARRLDLLDTLKKEHPGNVETMALDVTADNAVERFYRLVELIDGCLLYTTDAADDNVSV